MRTRSLLLGTLLAGVLLLILYQAQKLGPLENLAGELIRPLSLPLNSAGGDARDLAQSIREWQWLGKKNRELEELVDALMVENVRLAEMSYYQKLLQDEGELERANPNLKLASALVINREVPARVAGRDLSNFSHSLWIDRGASAGIQVGMPVVTRGGLVGRVAYVGSNWARVLLITDPRSQTNVLIQRTRATGILQGSPVGSLAMRLIPHNHEVEAGDLVLTSGLGGTFPKGLVVGQVVAVREKDYELYKEAAIRPAVDFQGLEVVSVVVGFQALDFAEEGRPLGP